MAHLYVRERQHMADRRRKRKSTRVEYDFTEDEGYADEKWVAGRVHEDAVPDDLAQDYRESGFRRRRCSFTTKKSGYPGKQSLRAHQKAHVRDRRAGVAAISAQAAWLAASVAGLSALVLYGPLTSLAFSLDLAPGLAVVAVSVLLALTQTRAASRAKATLHRGRIRIASALVTASRLFAVLALAAGFSGLAEWHWLIAIPALLAAGIYAAADIAYARIEAGRGKYRPSGYARMLKPRSRDAERRHYEHRMSLSGLARDGRLNPLKAKGRLRRHYDALELVRAWERGKARRREASERQRQRAQELKRKELLRQEGIKSRGVKSDEGRRQSRDLSQGEHGEAGGRADGPESTG